MNDAPSSVNVAVRVRPLVSNETSKGCEDIIEIVKANEQIVLKTIDKAFTFNYVFGPDSSQEELYSRSVKPLLQNFFNGLNVTIFAYGQTGSGKTHSMGTTFSGGDEINMGVIPRAVKEIYDKIRDNFSYDFMLSVSFMELYREVLYDLLAGKPRDQCILDLREDASKGVYVPNLTEVPVESSNEILEILMKGSRGRATAATNMNAHSSRSHSIFTINMAMQHKTDKYQSKTAKLHLVDLAGSERPKKTGAQGTTFKEGVDINKGLFVLGNVISALGDEKQQTGHIPYRDSNLTRLLKDSLGGNSVTLMIACVSPADYNLDETLSTLRYADRARKIKNKPIVNQDPKTAEINSLKKQIKQLQLQIVGQGGALVTPGEIDVLKSENKALTLQIRELRVQVSTLLLEKTGLDEKLAILESANEALNRKLLKVKEQFNMTFTRLSTGLETHDMQCVKENLAKLQEIQVCFDDLQKDQMETKNEIRNHEETFTMMVSTAKGSAKHDSKEVQEKAESHATTQMDLHYKIQDITDQLRLKEQLARQLTINTQNMVDEKAMQETQRKIEMLEKEKEELLQQIRNMKTQESCNKIAEQRRKRVQQLEDDLKDLKKKVTEQSRLLKLKEKDELKIKKLDGEIMAMKSTKVKLMKQMKEESEKFRTWKQKSERELARVKQQERKKNTEIAKMKVTYEKQKNVLKRKFEEAAALNKRLQNTLQKRKEAHEIRFHGKAEKVTAWLKEELEVQQNLVEAEATLAGLLEDRATLHQQLDDLKNNPEASEAEVKSIVEDIELRTAQIQDLQQKVLDATDHRSGSASQNGKFDAMQTMCEAKLALKTLFEHAVDAQKEQVQLKREMAEVQEDRKDLSEKVEALTKDIAMMEERHREELAADDRSYQEKIGILLRQMRGIETEGGREDSELESRIKIQNEKIASQEETIAQQETTIAELKKRLDDIKKASDEANTNTKKKIKRSKENLPAPVSLTPLALGDEDDLELNDDCIKDPDWQKTPLGKRMNVPRKKSKAIPTRVFFKNDETEEVGGSKRSSEGGCTCKAKCSTVRCGCRKLSRACSEFCKCSDSTCQNRCQNDENRDSMNSNVSTASSRDSTEQGDIKKPRVTDETDVPPKKSKKTIND